MRYSGSFLQNVCAVAVLMVAGVAGCSNDRQGTLTPGDVASDIPELDGGDIGPDAGPDAGPDVGNDGADGVALEDGADDTGSDSSGPDDVVEPLRDATDDGNTLLDGDEHGDAMVDAVADDVETPVDVGYDPDLWTFNHRGTRIPVGPACDDANPCTGTRDVCDPLHKVCVECVAETDCGRHHLCNVGTCIERPYGSYCISNYDCNDPAKPVCRSFEHKGNHPDVFITEATALAMPFPDSPHGFPFVTRFTFSASYTGDITAYFCSPSQASCPDGEIPFPAGCKKLCALDIDCPLDEVCHGLEPIPHHSTLTSLADPWPTQQYYGYCGKPACMGTFAPVDTAKPELGWHEVEAPPRRCPLGSFCVAGNDCLPWPIQRIPNALEPVRLPGGLRTECRTQAECTPFGLTCGRYNLADGTLTAGCVECELDEDCDGVGGVCDRTLGMCGQCRPANSRQAEQACPEGYECSAARQCRPAPCRRPTTFGAPNICLPVYRQRLNSTVRIARLNDDLSVQNIRSWVGIAPGDGERQYCWNNLIVDYSGYVRAWARMDQRCICSPHPVDPKIEICTPRERRPEDR